MALKVCHMRGTRCYVVIFATSPEEAVAQAIERELVGSWEMPEAVEVSLPPGYYLAYDPLPAAEQPDCHYRLTGRSRKSPIPSLRRQGLRRLA